MEDFQLAVIGSGFGGSLLSLIGRRLGLKTLLVEKGQHPRFAIGESTSPLANLVLEDLCREYDLPSVFPLSSYGTWQDTYPGLGCGLKRGFTFYHHQHDQPFVKRADRANELLVAASPSARVADTHWFRSDVDHFLVQQAIESGVEYLDNTTIRAIDFSAGGAVLEGETQGRAWRARAALVVDATGPRGLLSRLLGLEEDPWPFYPQTQALFSHFEGVPAFEGCSHPHTHTPTHPHTHTPPYPPERAAVHHVFRGGWIWSLRFENGITSAGVAAVSSVAVELRFSTGEEGWSQLLDRFPSLEYLRQAHPVRPFTYMPRLAYRCARISESPWALLPSAAAFVDPFLSTGIPLTLLGVRRMAQILEMAWSGGKLDGTQLKEMLAAYAWVTRAEIDAAALLVAGCYPGFAHFKLLSAYLMYYFAASSYAEIAWRLGQPEKARLFLRAGDLPFQNAVRQSQEQLFDWQRRSREEKVEPSPGEVSAFEDRVRRDISEVNVAGLMDPEKKNWYPVDLQDLVRSASCYGMTSEQMSEFVSTLPV